MLIEGNVAICRGAISAGCQAYFGYPITPQNEIIEFCASEFPKMGKVFVQAQSELGSINMLYGALASGARAMTATSGPGWSLMQETISAMVNAELPAVIVDVQRGGPGGQPIRHAQQDFAHCTRGGGSGDYKNIVLTPASAQECCDFMQLAFHLAAKYRNPVIVMSDALIGQTREVVNVEKIDFGPVPGNDWAAVGKGRHNDGKRHFVEHSAGFSPRYPSYLAFLEHLNRKILEMEKNEIRFECYQTDDAELVLVAYGYTARVSKEAVNRARAEGLRVGLIRLLTAWPFPQETIRQTARQGSKILVVEDSLGQMLEDVRCAAQGLTDLFHVGILDRHLPTDGGMILPEKVFGKIKAIMTHKEKAPCCGRK
jgi:2-oxoglutarate/2-oxoacid ferredoxin oxidoreductase subunit alpha